MTYDELINDGWHHHRNGIGGLGFFVQYDEDTETLMVMFDEIDRKTETFRQTKPLHVHQRMIDFLVAGEPSWTVDDCDFYRTLQDGPWTLAGFNHEDVGRGIAIQNLGLPDKATAVFSVDLLPDVNWMHNSWRGDYFHNAVAKAGER